MRKLWLAVAIIVVLLLGAWFVAAPYLTVRAIQAAAEAGDADALSSHIDYPAVRGSLKEQLKARAAKELGRLDPRIAELGGAFGDALIDQSVDALVQPKVIAALITGEDPSAGERPDRQEVETPEIDTKLGYTSVSEFEVTMTSPEMEGAVAFRLSRAGLGWKVTAIELPL